MLEAKTVEDDFSAAHLLVFHYSVLSLVSILFITVTSWGHLQQAPGVELKIDTFLEGTRAWNVLAHKNYKKSAECEQLGKWMEDAAPSAEREEDEEIRRRCEGKAEQDKSWKTGDGSTFLTIRAPFNSTHHWFLVMTQQTEAALTCRLLGLTLGPMTTCDMKPSRDKSKTSSSCKNTVFFFLLDGGSTYTERIYNTQKPGHVLLWGYRVFCMICSETSSQTVTCLTWSSEDGGKALELWSDTVWEAFDDPQIVWLKSFSKIQVSKVHRVCDTKLSGQSCVEGWGGGGGGLTGSNGDQTTF